MIIKTKKILGLWLLVLLLTGCGGLDKIPDDKQNYIGTWQGEYMQLTITAQARVEYQYKKGSSSKSISAPITKFDGNNFTVGALGIDTSFIVTTPPYLEDGIWKMVVDDQLVMRKNINNNSSTL